MLTLVLLRSPNEALWRRCSGANAEAAASAVVLLVAYDIADDESVWFDDVFLAEIP